MVSMFTVCAIVGSVILVLQFSMTLFGLDHENADIGEIGDDLEFGDDYVDAHEGASPFFSVLSFRSVVAAIALFGIGGRAALESGLSPYFALVVAIGLGATALFLVAWLMRTLYGLKSDGTVHIENCIGMPATVYLGIPAGKTGKGKVTVAIQDRTMEYSAITEDDEIPTGSQVLVVGVAELDTLEVEVESK